MQNLTNFLTGQLVYLKYRDTSGAVVYGSKGVIISDKNGMCVESSSGRKDYFKDIDGFYVEVEKYKDANY